MIKNKALITQKASPIVHSTLLDKPRAVLDAVRQQTTHALISTLELNHSRLRWPDDFRDEVLALLLELNESRHQEELLAGKAAEQAANNSKPKRAKKPVSKTLELF